jgi:hypothetical protein
LRTKEISEFSWGDYSDSTDYSNFSDEEQEVSESPSGYSDSEFGAWPDREQDRMNEINEEDYAAEDWGDEEISNERSSCEEFDDCDQEVSWDDESFSYEDDE